MLTSEPRPATKETGRKKHGRAMGLRPAANATISSTDCNGPESSFLCLSTCPSYLNTLFFWPLGTEYPTAPSGRPGRPLLFYWGIILCAVWTICVTSFAAHHPVIFTRRFIDIGRPKFFRFTQTQQLIKTGKLHKARLYISTDRPCVYFRYAGSNGL